jgi:hypothetical protein
LAITAHFLLFVLFVVKVIWVKIFESPRSDFFGGLAFEFIFPPVRTVRHANPLMQSTSQGRRPIASRFRRTVADNRRTFPQDKTSRESIRPRTAQPPLAEFLFRQTRPAKLPEIFGDAVTKKGQDAASKSLRRRFVVSHDG